MVRTLVVLGYPSVFEAAVEVEPGEPALPGAPPVPPELSDEDEARTQ